MMFTKYSYKKISKLQIKLQFIETQMDELQKKYEDTSREIHSIVTLLPMLEKWGLLVENCNNWISICRSLGLTNKTVNGHRMIKNSDETLHILLHKTLFNTYCSIDKVTYSE